MMSCVTPRPVLRANGFIQDPNGFIQGSVCTWAANRGEPTDYNRGPSGLLSSGDSQDVATVFEWPFGSWMKCARTTITPLHCQWLRVAECARVFFTSNYLLDTLQYNQLQHRGVRVLYSSPVCEGSHCLCPRPPNPKAITAVHAQRTGACTASCNSHRNRPRTRRTPSSPPTFLARFISHFHTAFATRVLAGVF
jgi:hypothetical protein